MASIESLSLAALAVKWRIPVDRLQPFVDQGYLRQVSSDGTPLGTIIQFPLPEVEDWIRSLLGPLTQRILLPISDVCTLIKLDKKRFHNLCGLFKITLFQDPVFGEMMSPKDYHRFLNHYDRFRGFINTDRQSFIVVMAKFKRVKVHKTQAYSQLMEDEIQRIIHLPEPQRTLAAGTLWKSWQDANTFTDCLENGGAPSVYNKKMKGQIDNKMYGLKKAIEGKDTWDNPHKYKGNIMMPGVGWVSRNKVRDAQIARHARNRAEKAAAIAAAQGDESSSAS